jgi:hypothetical protein
MNTGRQGAARPRWPAWLDPVLAALAAVAVHAHFLFSDPFFFGDDFGCLADVDNLSRGTTSFWSLPAWGVWRLGHRAWLWLQYALFGLRPWAWHLTSVLLHAAVAALAVPVARALGAGRGRALMAGLLFASFAYPSLSVRFPAASGPLLASLAVLGAVAAWLRERPWLAAALTVAGALVYEQALASSAAMLALALLGRRHLVRHALPAVAASALFVAVNWWTLRATSKVFAYNASGLGALRQMLQAPALIADLPAAWRAGWALAAVPLLLGAAALFWPPLRGALAGLALAWSATLPLAGRATDWPAWYLYMPLAGSAIALSLALPAWRAWTAALAVLALVNVAQQVPQARVFVRQADQFRAMTLQTPTHPAPAAAVLVNLYVGLAWTAWQFGGTVRTFEVWDHGDGRTVACFGGASLAEAAAAARRAFPEGQRRFTFPDDLPAPLHSVRAPVRHQLFPWPPDGRVPR